MAEHEFNQVAFEKYAEHKCLCGEVLTPSIGARWDLVEHQAVVEAVRPIAELFNTTTADIARATGKLIDAYDTETPRP